MTTRIFRPGDFLTLDGRQCELVRLRGDSAMLRDVETDEVTWMLLRDLWAEADLAGILPPHLGAAEHLVESDDAARLAAHLVEVMDGTRPEDPLAEPRPEYDPASTTRTQRINTKAQQLKAAGFERVSPRTIRRQLKALEKAGQHGLVDGRRTRLANGLSKADPRVLATLQKVMEAETEESTGNLTRMYARFGRQLQKDFGDKVPVPAYRTIARYAGILRAGRYTTGDASTRRTAAKQPARLNRLSWATRPGERVEVDSTPLDVMVRGDDGNSYRAHLTAAIDVATGSCIGHLFRPGAAKGYDHAVLLAKMHCPTPLEPGSKARRLLASSTLPGKAMVSAYERLEEAPAVPYIVPQSITVDCGADYRSKTFLDACRHLEIDVVTANPGTPTDKPHVERFFRTVREGFAQYLEGFTGGSVAHRGRNIKAVLDIHEVDELFLLWVTTVYQCRPHNGLIDQLHPGVKLSPNQLYSRFVDVMGCVAAPLTSDDFISLMPAEYRKLTNTGIQLKGRRYDAEALQPYRAGTTSTKQKYEVRYNPHNIVAVWVKVEPGTYVECHLRGDHQFDAPFRDEVHSGPSEPTDEDTQDFLDAIEEMHLDARARIVRDQHRREGSLSPVPRPTVTDPISDQPTAPDEQPLPYTYGVASEEPF